MLPIIILQEAIAAGFFILCFMVILFVLAGVAAWFYFSHFDKKQERKGLRGYHNFFRFVKSVGVAIALVIIFILLLLLWNPVLE